ncbi:MAG: tRNA (adenosine(37)-N6)-dimethylallyltransferase MiaA [Armatimonadetes bacterium]|nr:tRNA (adenosine(37)-N6)-dimethylallyltransferase MiaA [Armatimonadota bacterium]
MAGPILIGVMGPTASGKSDLAEHLADKFNAALINADAFQMYRYMDIGTGKPLDKTRYELLDILEPSERSGAGEFINRALPQLQRSYESGRSAIVVGGTGMYIRALFEEFADIAAPASQELKDEIREIEEKGGLELLLRRLEEIDPHTSVDKRNPARVKRALEKVLAPSSPSSFRLPYSNRIKLTICHDKPVLESRIATRVEKMVHNGWISETERLRSMGYGPDCPGFRAIGYRAMWRVLEGEIRAEVAIEETVRDTRLYAKRQRTWLRKEPGLISLEGDTNLFLRAEEIVRSAGNKGD